MATQILATALLLLAGSSAQAAGRAALGASSPSRAARASSGLYEAALESSLRRLQGDLQNELELFALRSDWENPWSVASQAYEVRTTHSKTLGRNLARGLDQSLTNFEALLGTSYRPTQRFVILVHPTIADYNALGDDLGDEHSSFYGSFFTPGNPESAVAALYDPNWTRLSMWVTHGAFHQYASQALSANLPLWLEEGLASYFAGFWDWEWTRQRFEDLRSRNALIPLNMLLPANTAGYVDRSDDRLLELCMLVHYLLNVREDTRTEYDEEGNITRAPFRDYVRLLGSGGNFAQQPVHALITRRLDELQRDFQAATF